ncbi:hypothetical protein [Izhakiella australiensis]|uniref:hypothetical protein n=1 Tax=Izhakiella australiensis TaxID=1926881 RepID=UPI0015926253|nr:hypothetical protein [Izhakiella australiensis]
MADFFTYGGLFRLAGGWLISPAVKYSVRLCGEWHICPPLRATGKGPSNVMVP